MAGVPVMGAMFYVGDLRRSMGLRIMPTMSISRMPLVAGVVSRMVRMVLRRGRRMIVSTAIRMIGHGCSLQSSDTPPRGEGISIIPWQRSVSILRVPWRSSGAAG